MSTLQQLIDAALVLADRNVTYDGNKIVIPMDGHGKAIKAMSDLRMAIAKAMAEK